MRYRHGAESYGDFVSNALFDPQRRIRTFARTRLFLPRIVPPYVYAWTSPEWGHTNATAVMSNPLGRQLIQ